MKVKAFLAQAVAGLVICGLFAPGASAEETKELTFCGRMDPAEEARLADPSLTDTPQESQEVFERHRRLHCASVMVPASEQLEVTNDIVRCLEQVGVGRPDDIFWDWDKPDIERCIAENGLLVKAPAKSRRSKRSKHLPAKGRHRSPQSGAEIALAR
jgi:hypothetical protein